METKATLDDLPLLASTPISWSLRSGVQPYTSQFDMVPEHADRLLAKVESSNQPVTLKIESGGLTQTFENLYVVGRTPSMVPYIDRIVVSDRRWIWRYGHIGPRRYNWRRRVGYKRLVSVGSPETIQDVADDVWYAAWSLRNPTDKSAYSKWDAFDMIQNVMRSVAQIEEEYNGNKIGQIIGITTNRHLKTLPIENLLLDDSADQALQRALAYLPEMTLYITPEGYVKFYTRSSGNEKEMADNAGPEKVGGGIISLVSNRYRRPRKIHVLFTREVELRFDFEEIDFIEGREGLRTLQPHQMEQRRLQNVMPMPDFESPVKKTTQGTWTVFNEAISEWNNDKAPGANGKLGWPTLANGAMGTLEYIRRAMIPFIDLWANLNISGLVDAHSDWMGRVSAIQANYRRTFQIVPSWWDSILSIHNYRVAIINKETGARAPSLVYGDFCRINNQRSMFRDAYAQDSRFEGGGGRGSSPIFYAINAVAYPTRQLGGEGRKWDPASEYPLSNLPGNAEYGGKKYASDAKITIADADQGVIRIEYVPDIFHAYDLILPGLLESSGTSYTIDGLPIESGPSLDLATRATGVTFDSVADFDVGGDNFERVPQLKEGYKMAVIMTAIPATWNVPMGEDKNIDQQLEKITIDPTTGDGLLLKEIVHPNVADTLQDAIGPDLYIRVGSGVEVARVAWDDNRWSEIDKVFGHYHEQASDEPPNIEDLVINRGTNEAGASLNQISLAIAARVYSGYVDHVQGAMRGTLVPKLHPTGWLDEVTYTVGATGEGSVSLDMPESVDQFDMMSYLDESTRAVIMKLAQP